METDWYIITSGPRGGKSPVIEALAFKGYSIRPEAASIVINQGFSEGKTLKEIRGNELGFQDKVLEEKIAAEDISNPKELIFWDRGIPDSITYYRINGGNTERIEKAIRSSNVIKYKGIFILDLLPGYTEIDDPRRNENEDERRLIHEGLIEDYKKLNYNPIIIPVLPISERVARILQHIKD